MKTAAADILTGLLAGLMFLVCASPLAIVMLMVFASSAWPQAHQHPPQDAELHEKFYQGWMKPDKPTESCCNKMDCYPTEARYRDGEWYALQRETNKWVHIPQEKIEYHRDNPDGRNHVCMSSFGTVYCFIYGGGT